MNTHRKTSRSVLALGLALLTSLAFAASASALSMSPGAGTSMSGSSGNVTFSTGTLGGRSCSAGASELAATDGTSGTISLRLSGCKGPFNISCTTSGQPTGVIVTPALKYKLVYLDAAKTKFGLMLIPPTAKSNEKGEIVPGTGTFAEFNCNPFGAFVWRGSVLGQITSPALNVASNYVNLQFTSSGNTQTYRQIEGVGSEYQLTESGNSKESAIAINTDHLLASAAKVTFLP